MEHVFIKLLNMSITASWLVLAIVIFRLLFKKGPKALNVVLWALVGIRLICPFSIESVLSLVPSTETVPQDIVYSNTPTIESGIPALNSTLNPIISETLKPEQGASVNPVQIWLFVASNIWVIGIVVMVLYTAISYWRIHRKVRESVRIQENVWMCDRIETPFILGVFRPHIYLPSNMSEEDIKYVLAHEQAHMKRHDHWWKPLGFALLTVYWFNPVLWVAYVLLCRDIELACDEKVIKEMGIEIKKPYSDALINCSIPRRAIAACPLAFGEVGVKERVKTVLNYKKPAFWIVLIAVVVCVVVAVCFLTNPKEDKKEPISTPSDIIQVSTSPYTGVDLGPRTLSAEDTSVMMDIVNKGSDAWQKDVSRVMCDFIFVVNDVQYSYSTTEGLFNDYEKYKMLVLSEEDRIVINGIIEKYLYSDLTTREAFRWFDYQYLTDDWDKELEIELAELPGVVFRCRSGEVTISNEDGIVLEVGGFAEVCHNGYFYDLTEDGIPELCLTLFVGSGIVDKRIIVYDYVTRETAVLEARAHYDYELSLENNELIATKTRYLTEEVVVQGPLVIERNDKTYMLELMIASDNNANNSYVLETGYYISGMEEYDPTASTIEMACFYLDTETQEFQMGENWLFPNALFGRYEFNGERLRLIIESNVEVPTGDSVTLNVLVLYLNEHGSFVYDEKASTIVSEVPWFKDGMVFSLMPMSFPYED